MSNNGQRWCETALWRLAKREEYAYEFGPDQLVRWAAMPPVDTMEQTLAWLATASACAAMTLEGRPVTGDWKTVWAGWQPVGSEADGATRPLRLVHVCVPSDAAGTGAAYVTENNCTYRVTVTPYFRQAAVADAPAGGSGTVYRVTGERRDDLTGEWQYQIEKREQLTTTAPARIKEENAFRTVWQQGFYGVRTGDLDHNGDAVPLWDPSAQPAGTVVELVFLQKNDNCTTDIIQTKTEAKAVSGAKVERERDLFAERESVTDRNQAAGAAEFETAENGLTARQTKDANPDGTWDNTRETSQERTVANARSRTSRSGEETVTETLHRSQTAGAALPAEEEGATDELVIEKTKGGWFDNRLVRAVARLISGAERRVVKDLYETVEEGVDLNVATADKPAEIGEPAAGVWYEQAFRRITSHMRWRVGLTRHTEKHVPVARYSQSRTPLLSRARTEARNSPVGDSLAADEYGSLDLEKTRGGLWSGGKELVADTLGAVAATEYQSDYLETRSERQEVVSAEGAAGSTLGGRTVTRLSFRRTDGGNWLKTTLQRTAPEARQFTLIDHTVVGALPGSGMGSFYLVSHTKTVLFLNSDMSSVSAVSDAFVAGKNPFVTTAPGSSYRYYWSYEIEIGFGLRPDEFGTWTGTMTLRASAINKGNQFNVVAPAS